MYREQLLRIMGSMQEARDSDCKQTWRFIYYFFFLEALLIDKENAPGTVTENHEMNARSTRY